MRTPTRVSSECHGELRDILRTRCGKLRIGRLHAMRVISADPQLILD
jgi:hypothetical protein